MKADQQRKQREERPKRETARAAPARQPAVAVSPGCAFDGMGNRALAALLRSGHLQRKTRSAAPGNPPDNPENAKHRIANAAGVLGQLDGGRELNRNTREGMEARFGLSFSDVRIHTGHRAADAAAMFQARAFTASNDIVFGDGEFAPETTEGQRLLAHELAHVAQKKGSEASPGTAMAKLSISEAGDPLEREADAAAESVLAGRSPMLNTPRKIAMPTISRQPADKPKKGQTPQDFTVESEYGRPGSYYIRFPHFIEEKDAQQILFAHGKAPEGVELEYQGPMRGGWTFMLRSKSAGIGPASFVEFTPILLKHFHPDVLALTPEETAAHRKTQEEFLDSRPVYLGGQTVREAMTLKDCKDHAVPGQIGTACWGERAGYFYWVGFDSAERGVTLEVKSSPHTANVIKDWEWFLSHSPADYVPHATDLPYAATFNPNSKASFTLNEADRLENELKNWEFTHEVMAWISTMQATAGAVGSLRAPPPLTLTGQSVTTVAKGIQTYEAVKAASGGDQTEFDMVLMGIAGVMEHSVGMTGNLSGRPPKRPAPVEEPLGSGPSGGQTRKAVAHGGEVTAAKGEAGEPKIPADEAAAHAETIRAAKPPVAGEHMVSPTEYPPDELAQRRAALAAKAADVKAAARAKVAAQAVQQRRVRAAAGGASGGGGPTEVGSVETTVEGGAGGTRTVAAGGTKEPAFRAGAASDPESVTQALSDARFSREEIAALGEENTAGLNARAATKVASLGKHFTMEDLRALARYLAGSGKVLSGAGAAMLVKNVQRGDMERVLGAATHPEAMRATGVAPGIGSPRLRLVGPEPDLGGLGPALVHPTPMTPEEMFELLVSQRAFAFNERGGAANIDPRALGPGGQALQPPPPGLGANVGPAAGGRQAGQSVFAVVEIVDSSGRAVIRGAGQFLGADDLHAEQSALAGLDRRLGGHAPEIEGGELKVVVDQMPCGPENANCSLALRQFADAYGLRLRVFVPERAVVGRPNAAAGPRASTMGSQRTGMPEVHMREMDAAELEHAH
jgi:hypothetical protein